VELPVLLSIGWVINFLQVEVNLLAVLREPPWGTDGQTARALLRSKQAPRVGGGTHKIHGEAAN